MQKYLEQYLKLNAAARKKIESSERKHCLHQQQLT